MYQIITDPATGDFCLFHTAKGKTTATAPATSHPHRRARKASIKYPHLTQRLWKAATIAAAGTGFDTRGYRRALMLDGSTVSTASLGESAVGADLTRTAAAIVGETTPLGQISHESAARWRALALVITTADLVGVSRGALDLAVEYAKIREQYGQPIGSYQAVAHLLAEGLTLIEGSVSILRHAAWAVDELEPAEAVRAAQVAKMYCARAARTVCETSIQVHGGIGNTWECLAHVFLRRALTSTQLWPVKLEEIDLGFS